ncbi:aldehyde dehydrogenase (NAD+) [Thermocatellispora tengchongensis]|uniref:aldehyde dehydrogenase (NAD(+)) n=1 Tax=Thermocatellispora tengchongensis TaxID=1073253 RepID=A0A840PCZ5_9ACTN|nr:aldehyde dehydrogenase family protein [Thermocatellispora tengchongensis]MBB5136859.1 aldehyde dehydrogenase (NAD+) [Thermocatellispora tengchongensis]
MEERKALYIAGEWTAPRGDGVIEVENPATEERIGAVPAGTAEDVDLAVRAARAAFPAWSATSFATRADGLRRLHDALASREDVIARTVTSEVGTPLTASLRSQARLPRTVVGGYAEMIAAGIAEERIGNSLVLREPVGVVAAITPWNFPLHQITCKLAPALAAGCTVVIKPSEVAPLAAYLLMDAVHEAGFPPGVVNMVPGYGPVAGEALAAHPEVDMVSFTGSVRAGSRVARLAGAAIKKVALELGGKSANVVLDDADLETAVKVGVAHAFLNTGQACVAWSRLLVHADRYEQAVELAKRIAEGYRPGDPLDPATKLGPLVSAVQLDRVRGYIETGLAEGARLVTGGPARPAGFDRGHYIAPTVLADVDPDATVAQEEIFGPVLSVIPFRDDDEALRIANNSRYGLSGAVWSADPDRALNFARRVRTGTITVNGGAYNPLAPFGGYKQSGIGREMGRYGLEEFCEIKSVQL